MLVERTAIVTNSLLSVTRLFFLYTVRFDSYSALFCSTLFCSSFWLFFVFILQDRVGIACMGTY